MSRSGWVVGTAIFSFSISIDIDDVLVTINHPSCPFDARHTCALLIISLGYWNAVWEKSDIVTYPYNALEKAFEIIKRIVHSGAVANVPAGPQQNAPWFKHKVPHWPNSQLSSLLRSSAVAQCVGAVVGGGVMRRFTCDAADTTMPIGKYKLISVARSELIMG